MDLVKNCLIMNVHLLYIFMYYNFVRIHKTLKVTPVIEAGTTNKLWSMEDIVEVTDEYHAK